MKVKTIVLHIIAPLQQMVWWQPQKRFLHPSHTVCFEGASHLNSTVGGLPTASKRRQGLSKQPHQSPERLGALEFSDARTGHPANTLETRQVIGERSWQTSRVKLVLAALEFVSETPRCKSI